MMMMISWIHQSRIGQMDGEKRKKKRTRNRASQERLTSLTDRFTDDQKGAATEMGMQALMNVRCTNLVNPICDWLGEIYDPASREFVISGRGRLPLNEESMFCTLGVPRGQIKVPYEVNNKIEEALFPCLFPGLESMPNMSVLAKLKDVKNMNWCKFIADFLHDAFSSKMYQKGCRLHLMLMYVDCLDLSIVDFIGTGGLPPTHKFAVSAWTINAVKAVLAADSVTHTKYGKLQLMAKHAIDYSVFGGPQNFGKWMDVHSAPSCPTEVRAPVEHLIGQFASGMTVLLGKLVEGWTSLNGFDSDAVARQFTTFVPERTHRPTGCRGRYDYNSSQELADTQDELDGDAGLSKDDDDDMENVQQDTDDDEHVEVRVGGKKGKDAPDVPPPEKVKEHTTARGEGVLPSKRGRAPEDVGQGSPGKRVKKTTTRGAKHIIRGPLECLHSKLSTGGNSDVHEAPVDKTAAAPSTVPTNSDASGRPSPPVADVQVRTTGIRTSGSDESVSARTAEILPNLLAMKDAAVSHATPSASVEVDAPETNLSKEDSRSSDTDSKRVHGGTPVSTIEVAEAAVHNVMEKPEDRSTTDAGVKPGTSDAGERPEQTAPLPAVEIPSLNLRTSRLPVNVGVPYSPNKKIVKEAAADTADNTPRPTNKSDHSVAADSDMFVDLSPLDSAPQVVRGPANRHERHPMALTPSSFSLGISQDQPVVPDPMPVAFAFPGGMPAMMAQLMVEGRKAVKFAEPIVQGTPEEISPSLDEAYCRIKEAALQRRSSRGQGQSCSNVPADTVSEDTIRSATPGSVRQQRVVHPPPAEDYEPEVRDTKEQTQLYDIVKRFGNARASSKHMKEMKA
ncbi:unnamed protein product [Triticum turgidum subsp. durum]|uniref:Uncharacterized protein n=1 Tax=Triticum turgidum subsp. durum TaxID=4567 RepID=A0A9R0WPF9_TRITD|nr:unnamed protein product [Triticum turgidum subsp. durum]